MGAKPDWMRELEADRTDANEIEQLLREEAAHSRKNGEAATKSRKTLQALDELARCNSLDDYRRMAESTRGWEDMTDDA